MWNAFPPIPLLHTGVLILASCMLVIASLNDIAVRAIPNIAPLGLAGLGIVARIADGNVVIGAGASTTVLSLAAVCWRFGWLGGGDVKLLAACALLVPPTLAPQLVILTALAGGLLALLYLTLCCAGRISRTPLLVQRPRTLAGRIARAEWWRIRRRAALPYGCAITVATLLILVGR